MSGALIQLMASETYEDRQDRQDFQNELIIGVLIFVAIVVTWIYFLLPK